jgi:hypothetical protein
VPAPPKYEPPVPPNAWFKRQHAREQPLNTQDKAGEVSSVPLKSFGLSLEKLGKKIDIAFASNDGSMLANKIYQIKDLIDTYYVFLADDPTQDNRLHLFIRDKVLIVESGRYVVHPLGASGDYRMYCSKQIFMIGDRSCTLYVGDKVATHSRGNKISSDCFVAVDYVITVRDYEFEKSASAFEPGCG